jgi:hypothetical protein
MLLGSLHLLWTLYGKKKYTLSTEGDPGFMPQAKAPRKKKGQSGKKSKGSGKKKS